MSAPAEGAAVTLRGVLLDIDGTLIDSNDAHARSWVDALAEAGFHPGFATVRALIGKGGDHIIPELTGLAADDPRGRQIAARVGEIFTSRYLATLRPFPEVRPLLERMTADGLALVAATSAKEDEVAALLDVAGVRDLFDGAASHGDAAHSKPDPGIVDAAIRRAGLAPERLVMIGDTPYDVAAATRAGVRCVAFRCGGWSDAALHGAVAIYDGAWDLLDRYAAFRATIG